MHEGIPISVNTQFTIQIQSKPQSRTGGRISPTIGNFQIDTAASLVFANLFNETTGTLLLFGVRVFDFGTDTSQPGMNLRISSLLAAPWSDTVDLTGVQFGFATPEITAVPLPAGRLFGWNHLACWGPFARAAGWPHDGVGVVTRHQHNTCRRYLMTVAGY